MVKKFVPRQRKHKVLARQNGSTSAIPDSNAVEIIPSEQEKQREDRKARMRAEILAAGPKVSGKKLVYRVWETPAKSDRTIEL